MLSKFQSSQNVVFSVIGYIVVWYELLFGLCNLSIIPRVAYSVVSSVIHPPRQVVY